MTTEAAHDDGRADVHFVEVDTTDLSTDTRVILAVIRIPARNGEGHYPVIGGLVTLDDAWGTVEVVRVDTGWRRQGLGRALVTAAEVAAGRGLGPSREFSSPGKALWRSLGRSVPRGTVTARTAREGESYGALLMSLVMGQLLEGDLTTKTVLTDEVRDRIGGITVKLPDTHRSGR